MPVRHNFVVLRSLVQRRLKSVLSSYDVEPFSFYSFLELTVFVIIFFPKNLAKVNGCLKV